MIIVPCFKGGGTRFEMAGTPPSWVGQLKMIQLLKENVQELHNQCYTKVIHKKVLQTPLEIRNN